MESQHKDWIKQVTDPEHKQVEAEPKDPLCTCDEPPFRGYCAVHDTVNGSNYGESPLIKAVPAIRGMLLAREFRDIFLRRHSNYLANKNK